MVPNVLFRPQQLWNKYVLSQFHTLKIKTIKCVLVLETLLVGARPENC